MKSLFGLNFGIEYEGFELSYIEVKLYSPGPGIFEIETIFERFAFPKMPSLLLVEVVDVESSFANIHLGVLSRTYQIFGSNSLTYQTLLLF